MTDSLNVNVYVLMRLAFKVEVQLRVTEIEKPNVQGMT
jgi:hypothetical protein